MRDAGHLDATAFGAAIATPVNSMLAGAAQRASIDPAAMTQGPYFVGLVTGQLFRQFGAGKALTGGLRVYTTLDTEVQHFAEAAVMKRLNEIDQKRMEGEPLQAALVAIEPSAGYVRAVVGGRSFAESPFNRATMAKRQPGSAYTAFANGGVLQPPACGWATTARSRSCAAASPASSPCRRGRAS
jgi:membrane peptidoglycan carboxypeptidase